MKEITHKIDHSGEPKVDYSNAGYSILRFPYFDFEIEFKCVDKYNTDPKPDIHLKIFLDDQDVTFDYMDMSDAPGFIRPTLYNLQQVIDVLDENMMAEDEEEENTIDTRG